MRMGRQLLPFGASLEMDRGFRGARRANPRLRSPGPLCGEGRFARRGIFFRGKARLAGGDTAGLRHRGVAALTLLIDSAGMDTIASDGASCEGADGYSEIGHDTPVTVKNGTGAILATTSLGQGKGSTANCTFSFSFPVTEGQDRYVVSVGRRGEFSYTFEQLRVRGVQIHLGQ